MYLKNMLVGSTFLQRNFVEWHSTSISGIYNSQF